jgi:hypothetical protein
MGAFSTTHEMIVFALSSCPAETICSPTNLAMRSDNLMGYAPSQGRGLKISDCGFEIGELRNFRHLGLGIGDFKLQNAD